MGGLRKRLWVSKEAAVGEVGLREDEPVVGEDEEGFAAGSEGGVEGAGEGRWKPSVRERTWGLYEL